MNPLVREHEVERKMYRRIRQVQLLTDTQLRSMLCTYSTLRSNTAGTYFRVVLHVDEQCLLDIETAENSHETAIVRINKDVDRTFFCEPAFQRTLTRVLLLWPDVEVLAQTRMNRNSECYWVIPNIQKSKVLMFLLLIANTAEAFYHKRLDRPK